MNATREDIGRTLQTESARMREFAHDPEHWILVYLGENPGMFPELRYREKLPAWETAIIFHYSVDVLADGRAFSHLSIQISVPGKLAQGVVNANVRAFLEELSPLVGAFLPFAEEVGHRMIASPPVPVVSSLDGADANVHFRTPVTFHFTVVREENVPLVGPDHPRRIAAGERTIAATRTAPEFMPGLAQALAEKDAEIEALKALLGSISEAADGGEAPVESLPTTIGFMGQQWARQAHEIENLKAELAGVRALMADDRIVELAHGATCRLAGDPRNANPWTGDMRLRRAWDAGWVALAPASSGFSEPV